MFILAFCYFDMVAEHGSPCSSASVTTCCCKVRRWTSRQLQGTSRITQEAPRAADDIRTDLRTDFRYRRQGRHRWRVRDHRHGCFSFVLDTAQYNDRHLHRIDRFHMSDGSAHHEHCIPTSDGDYYINYYNHDDDHDAAVR